MSSGHNGLSRTPSAASFKKSLSSLSLSTLFNSLNFVNKSSKFPSNLEDTESSLDDTCYDYPGQAGEEVCTKFELIRKLGKGNYSSVWLAKSTKQDKYVALKILTNRASKCHAMHMIDEVSILKTISTSDSSHPGFSHVVSLTDSFLLRSVHGEHLSLAFPDVLGQSFCDLRRRSSSNVISLAVVRKVLKQVLLALEYIHDCCKIVHTDLKPDNILVCLSDPQFTIRQLVEGTPRSCSSQSKSSRPPPLSPLPTPTDILDDPQLKIKLIDFGHAQRISEHLTDQVQAPSLRAPEVILGYTWGTGIDIWSLGCITFELLTGHWLFQPKASSKNTWTAEDQHLQRMVEYTGDIFSRDMIEKSSRGANYFDEAGRFRRIRSLHPVPIEKALEHYETIPDTEVQETAGFIRRCLTLDPLRRVMAKDLLSDSWLRGCD